MNNKRKVTDLVFRCLLTPSLLTWTTWSGILALSGDMKDLKSSIQFSQGDLDDLKATIVNQDGNLQAISDNLSNYQASIKKLTAKLNNMDNHLTRKNDWLMEFLMKNLKWEVKLSLRWRKYFMRNWKIDLKLIEFDRVNRSGKYDQSGQPRSIVIELLRYKDKQEILKIDKALKGTSIFIMKTSVKKSAWNAKNYYLSYEKRGRRVTLLFLDMINSLYILRDSKRCHHNLFNRI